MVQKRDRQGTGAPQWRHAFLMRLTYFQSAHFDSALVMYA